MRRVFVVLATLAIVNCVSEGRVVADSAPNAKDPKSPNQLMHVQGKFVGLRPTGKRHQSFIFSFRIEHELRGPGEQPIPKEEVVRFELHQDLGGGNLVRELGRHDPKGRIDLKDAADSVKESKRYQLVLWRFPPNREPKDQQPNTELVKSPISLHE